MSVADSDGKILTASEAADYLGIGPSGVTKLCREGKLRGSKHGRDWLLTLAEVRRYRKERKPVGRPTGS